MLNKLTLETVKLLREQTGYGLIQCKEALTQAMNNTTNFNQDNLLKEAKKYLDKDVDYIYNGIEITHEQVLKQHKELKQWLNKMPIDQEYYINQMDTIYDYIKQQWLQDLSKKAWETFDFVYLSNGDRDFIILNQSYDKDKAFEVGKHELQGLAQYDTYEIMGGFASYGYYEHWDLGEKLGFHAEYDPTHRTSDDQVQVWVVRGEHE